MIPALSIQARNSEMKRTVLRSARSIGGVAIAGFLAFTAIPTSSFGADNAVCNNIRLSAAEQFQCRHRLDNALGPGDAQRTRREFENKTRAATNVLITPPVMLGALPSLPDSGLKLPATPKTVPHETGALGLPNTPSAVPPDARAFALPDTPSGVPTRSTPDGHRP
jgi:hypothetical protein